MDEKLNQSDSSNVLDQIVPEDRRRVVERIEHPRSVDFIVKTETQAFYAFIRDEKFLIKYLPSEPNNPIYFRFTDFFGIDLNSDDNFSENSRYFNMRHKLYKRDDYLKKGGYLVFVDELGKTHYHPIVELYLILPRKQTSFHKDIIENMCKQISRLFKDFFSF